MGDGDRFTFWLPTKKEVLLGILWYTLCVLFVGVALGVLIFKIGTWIF